MAYHRDMNSDLLDPKPLGKCIRFLRRSHHWTQAELAEKVGIRTGPMNYLENGHHLPSLPVVCKLASIFGITTDQLLGGLPEEYGAGNASGNMLVRQSEDIKFVASTDYRASQALYVRLDPCKAQLTEDDLARIEDIIDAFMGLEDLCGVQKQAKIALQLRLPQRESGLPTFVETVRALLGVRDAVIFDYLELLENAGLRIVFLPLSDKVESVSCYDRLHANAFLFIRSTGLSVERQLFRLSYELGRIYMYNGGMRARMQIGELDTEHAARRFAALFLMPAEAMIASVQQVGVEPGEWNWDLLMRLKHRFGVSAEAFLYRLEELELIAKSVRDRLKSEIYAYYAGHDNAEPDSARRILTPNGRLGDLLLSAEIKAAGGKEIAEIRARLKKHKIRMP